MDGLGAVKVLVPQEFAEEARKLIKEIKDDTPQ
jgi:hypothetical protein